MQPVAQTSQPKILIVDDEPSIREILLMMLSGRYRCETASCFDEAMALLREGDYQLMLSDIAMQGRNGLELLSEAIALKPDMSVLMVSGAQNIENAIQAQRRGAFDYIVKPFTLEQAEMAVERALKQQAIVYENRCYKEHLEELVEQRAGQLRQLNATMNDMFQDLYLNYRATLQALASAIEMRDVETHGHSQRVVTYCLRFGQQLGLSDLEMVALEHGALLHDIGKIGTPDSILLKPDKLTPEEWKIMRGHIDNGAAILRGIAFLADALPVVTQHHERWDGSGYPLGLRGRQISLNARIFAVADALDAITSDRPYHKARSFEEAAREITAATGTHFDPEVVETFLSIPLDEWRQIRQSVESNGGSLTPDILRSIRSLIVTHKTGRLSAPLALSCPNPA
ncbi:MAG TPA: HD domain-containing phosphohydrolase [Blastocatellia bacterium]|nr:HD domain-containing phosphohydrolase [Blastocatellia bacterium]